MGNTCAKPVYIRKRGAEYTKGGKSQHLKVRKGIKRMKVLKKQVEGIGKRSRCTDRALQGSKGTSGWAWKAILINDWG